MIENLRSAVQNIDLMQSMNPLYNHTPTCMHKKSCKHNIRLYTSYVYIYMYLINFGLHLVCFCMQCIDLSQFYIQDGVTLIVEQLLLQNRLLLTYNFISQIGLNVKSNSYVFFFQSQPLPNSFSPLSIYFSLCHPLTLPRSL